MKIAVAGTGYVGLSMAVLLAQRNKVTAVDIIPEKVQMINDRRSPIQDKEIEEYLATKPLDLTATLNGAEAYGDAEAYKHSEADQYAGPDRGTRGDGTGRAGRYEPGDTVVTADTG